MIDGDFKELIFKTYVEPKMKSTKYKLLSEEIVDDKLEKFLQRNKEKED